MTRCCSQEHVDVPIKREEVLFVKRMYSVIFWEVRWVVRIKECIIKIVI